MHHQSIKHPGSLRIFFATEMWERYGFYVIQTLLALFLSLHFHWDDKSVYALTGSFTALTYVSPILGGWIADHAIGQKRSVLAGAVVLFVCYLALAKMAFVSGAHVTTLGGLSKTGLVMSLAGIVVGSGLLKPNISSLVGNAYPEGSPNRERGFTLFYLGITVGIMMGSTIPGVLARSFGWSAAFMSAAFGLLIGFLVFLFGVYRYHIADYNNQKITFKAISLAILMIVSMGVLAFYILINPVLADFVFLLVAVGAVGYFVLISKRESDPILSAQTTVIGLLCLISVLFWALYFQIFLSLTLFITRVVEPILFGILFPAPYYVCIQSLGAVVFGAMFASRVPRGVTPQDQGLTSGRQFVKAVFFLTMSYLILSIVCHLSTDARPILPAYIIVSYLSISLAELRLYPVGMSVITVLADRNKASTMMGLFFLSLGMGGFLSGKLAYLTAIPSGERSMAALKLYYTVAFDRLLLILILCLLASLLVNRLIRRLLTNTSIG